ncbi:MAG: tyrosine-type recombinase/integrase [Desulfatirhabdiaceae bacterium]
MMNPNHPKKGTETRVDPIKNLKDIKLLKKILKEKPRDHALFVMGINTNLRASDLINITVGQVRHLKPGDDLTLKEIKTGKTRRITLNGACVTAIQDLLESSHLTDSDPLFKSRKGDKLIVPTVSKMVKNWCRQINLKGNFAAHTLRKTWGYHQRVTYNTDIPTLMECFNHSSQKQTLTYLCVQPDEIRGVYENEL